MKANDPMALDFTDVTSIDQLYPQSRREFLKRFGGGIIIFVAIGDLLEAQEGARPRGGRPGVPSDFNAFLRIGEDGRVTCFVGKIEMGQGPITSLPQMLAEELEVGVDSIDMVMGDTELCPYDQGTWGSMSTRFLGPTLRAAGAEAKGVLLELASDALKLPQDRLVARDGSISDREHPETRIGYGQLAKGQKIERHLQSRPGLKDVSQFKIIGKPLSRRDAKEKVTGRAQYAGDIRLPGMVYARILRPPAHGAKLKSADTSAAKAMPGVEVIEQGDLVAVLHALPDVAEQALGKIKAEFEPSESKLDDRNIYEHLLSVAPAASIGAKGGDLEAGRKLAAKSFEKTYLNAYVAHSPMEPHVALAKMEGDKVTIWASTQTPFGMQGEVAQALGLPSRNVRVLTPFVGGGFGGKGVGHQGVEAARLAKAAGKPVQVMWTREEEFFYDSFRPAAVVKIQSGVDAAGKITFWDYDVFFAGDRGAAQFYSVPNHRTASHGSGFGGPANAHPFATGAWRAPGNNTNTFARECQIDIMAAAAGLDPVDFRLRNLTDRRMIRVLKSAADKINWSPAKAPSKRGFGVACGIDAGAYVAAIAEVKVDSNKGTVQVSRVVCAQDMGIVVNPEGAKMQMEGCIMMGLGYALTEEVHFKNGEVVDTNYDTYEIPRFSWLPVIETVLIDENEIQPQGGGEPAVILMGALIANAIHDATGARLLQLPMTPERLLAALHTIT